MQVGGFADFEELLNDVRDECHEAVQGALMLQVPICNAFGFLLTSLSAPQPPCILCCMQAVDVRRGRLVAHVESFVHMLGISIEALMLQVWIGTECLYAATPSTRFELSPVALDQMRIDRRAELEALGIEEDEDHEDDWSDAVCPANLPPRFDYLCADWYNSG